MGNLIDMSQYQGEDREQVIAGYQVCLSLGQAGEDLVLMAPLINNVSAEKMVLESLFHGNRSRGPLNSHQATQVIKYMRACAHVHQVKRRLNPEVEKEWWLAFSQRFSRQNQIDLQFQLGIDHAS
jgi:hypothetical protein